MEGSSRRSPGAAARPDRGRVERTSRDLEDLEWRGLGVWVNMEEGETPQRASESPALDN